jgi:hypothetical protein
MPPLAGRRVDRQRQQNTPDDRGVTMLVVLVGVAIALLSLLAITLDRFWPVSLIALLLLGFSVIH